MKSSWLEPGANCWKRLRAGRAAFLIDGEDYFAAVASAIERAQRSVLMLGWDFHSRVRLRRGDGHPAEDASLAAVLDAAARRQPRLRAHVLAWDFAFFYAVERELLPLYQFNFRTHRRVRFRLDGQHPVGASHHQKLVVVDDAVAFCGGFDLTACRWDTRAHAARDPRRSDPGFDGYAPFHDVAMVVDGEAAAALGELARERWRVATGRRLRPIASGPDPWPEGVTPALHDVPVGIARTFAAHRGVAEAREVERLFLDGIRNARDVVYIENQYFTAQPVAEALGARLSEPEGPEVVVVVPRTCSGWLEEATMGELRARLLQQLRARDRFGRLRIYAPIVPDVERLNVHAKVMVIDDHLARVGSANLSNRSLGLDSECDLAVEAESESHREAILRFRNDLLREHLGVPIERLGELTRSRRSLIAAIEALRGGERSLEDFRDPPSEGMADVVTAHAVFDPESPADLEEIVAGLLPEDPEPETRPLLRRILLGLAGAALLAVLWRFTPLGDWLRPEQLARWAAPVREHPAAPLGAVIAFVVGGLVIAPVTAMIVACALVFGPLLGFGTAVVGTLASAAATYGVGRIVWRDAVRRIAGKRLNRVTRLLERRGALAMAAVRVVPVAPFTVVNLVAGASRLRFRDYMLGTALTMVPGIAVMTALSDRLARAIVDPGAGTFAAVLVVAGLAILGLRFLRRRLVGGSSHG